MEIIEREYGQFLTETEQGYNLSLQIDIDTLDPDPRQLSSLRIQNWGRYSSLHLQSIEPS